MYDIRFWESPSGRKPVRKWLDGLSDQAFKRIRKLLAMVERRGPALGMPHSRNLGDGLFELRETGTGPGHRLYYCEVESQIIVLLAGGDKGSQERDIVTARKRMENIED